MKVKLLQSLAGPTMCAAGTILETTEKEALSLIAAGFAEVYVEEEVEQSTSVKAEARTKAVVKKRGRKPKLNK